MHLSTLVPNQASGIREKEHKERETGTKIKKYIPYNIHIHIDINIKNLNFINSSHV